MLSGVALFYCAAAPVRAGDHVLQFTVATSAVSLPLDDPNLNGKPGAKLIVTQNLVTATNDHPIGVLFDAKTGPKGMWRIVNEDGVAMPVGAGFNVLVGPLKTVNASAANSLISNTLVKAAAGKPPFNPLPVAPAKAGFLFFTHNMRPFQALEFSVLVPLHQRAVYFGPSFTSLALRNKWTIETLGSDFPPAASYFVLDASNPPKGAAVFGHTTTSTGIALSFISNAATDNKPGAVLFITPLGNTIDMAFGVSYNTLQNQWAIVDEDGSNMTAGQDFNILVFPAPIP